MIEWFTFDTLPKENSRVLVSIGGYTQSTVWHYRNDIFYDDTKTDKTEVPIALLNSILSVSKWAYLPLSEKDLL
jgi:hypothetical protein